MDIQTYLTDLDRRFERIVSAKLGNVPVVLVEHRPNRDGSQTPVFRVPTDCRAKAQALGLTVTE